MPRQNTGVLFQGKWTLGDNYINVPKKKSLASVEDSYKMDN